MYVIMYTPCVDVRTLNTTYMCVHTHLHIHIYIYTDRERKRCMGIYIYV